MVADGRVFYIQLPVCIVPDLAEIKKREKHNVWHIFSFPLSTIYEMGVFSLEKL